MGGGLVQLHGQQARLRGDHDGRERERLQRGLDQEVCPQEDRTIGDQRYSPCYQVAIHQVYLLLSANNVNIIGSYLFS